MKNNIGTKIKELRKKAGLNQTEMAEKLGVHLQTISRYEKGKLIPSSEILSVLAEKFRVDAGWLLASEPSAVVEEQWEYSPGTVRRLHLLQERLSRIVYEGNEKKIRAIEAQLELLDPGERISIKGRVKENK